MVTKNKPLTIPQGWPRWNRRCNATRWRTGTSCANWAIVGGDKCIRHNGNGEIARERAWKRYLLFALLPDTVRENRTRLWAPVLDEEVEMVQQVVAHAVLYGDQHANETVRMACVTYLLDAAAVAMHPDPAVLLTHLTREDADTAVRILQLNNLLR